MGKCFELFVCTRPLDLASEYAISYPCKNSTVESEVNFNATMVVFKFNFYRSKW